MQLTTTLLNQSLEVAQEIFNHSTNLSNAGADSDLYTERVPYLQNLLGENGHVAFHPMVTKDLRDDFLRAVEGDYRRVHDDYYGHTFSSWEEEIPFRNKFYMSTTLKDSINSEWLIGNKVPSEVIRLIEREEIKGYNSPKLSKLLVKLYGEKSDVVKWYTNDCPKKLDTGLNTEYKVHLSTLPHHIAGMSYYAPYNWDGDKWETGWSGTSCMDTLKNSTGEGIYHLVPSLMDGTLAIAYLTETSNDDLFEPRFLARILVRVAKVTDNDYVMVGLRAFYTNNETKHTLIEGLKNEFENFIHVTQLRDDYDTYGNIKRFSTAMNVTWDVFTKYECSQCGGDGDDGDGGDCENCGGSGSITDEESSYRPYIDDEDVLEIKRNSVIIKLPKGYLVKKGLLQEEEVSPTFFNNQPLAC